MSPILIYYSAFDSSKSTGGSYSAAQNVSVLDRPFKVIFLQSSILSFAKLILFAFASSISRNRPVLCFDGIFSFELFFLPVFSLFQKRCILFSRGYPLASGSVLSVFFKHLWLVYIKTLLHFHFLSIVFSSEYEKTRYLNRFGFFC